MLSDSLRRADERTKTVRKFAAGGTAGYLSQGEKLAERKAAARHPALAQAMQAEQEKQRKQREQRAPPKWGRFLKSSSQASVKPGASV